MKRKKMENFPSNRYKPKDIWDIFGKVVVLPNDKSKYEKDSEYLTNKEVQLVDGQIVYHDVGKSHGIVHFMDIETGACVGFAGIRWVYKNCKFYKEK
jgi:hypothetical protein